jgi:hypothetical protein
MIQCRGRLLPLVRRTIVRASRTLLLLVCAAGTDMALADPPNSDHRWALMDDNDGMITHDDRHYTQGLRISDLLPETLPGDADDRLFNGLSMVLPMYHRGGDSHRRVEWVTLGQSMFTPTDKQRNPPDPQDRPYAGWLYTGAALLQENRYGDRVGDLNSIELLAGVVGKWALARQFQSSFHRTFGFGNAYAWSHQLANRAAVQLAYDRKERIELLPGTGFGLDAIPEAGFSVGSVLRYLDAGLLLRMGTGLQTDYGPDRIRPAPSGSSYFNEQAIGPISIRGYVFAGIQQRWIAYNRFIDGAAELGYPPLERRDAVTDLVAGCSLLVGRNGRLDFTATLRSREFATQQNNDIFGSASISLRL